MNPTNQEKEQSYYKSYEEFASSTEMGIPSVLWRFMRNEYIVISNRGLFHSPSSPSHSTNRRSRSRSPITDRMVPHNHEIDDDRWADMDRRVMKLEKKEKSEPEKSNYKWVEENNFFVSEITYFFCFFLLRYTV